MSYISTEGLQVHLRQLHSTSTAFSGSRSFGKAWGGMRCNGRGRYGSINLDNGLVYAALVVVCLLNLGGEVILFDELCYLSV